MKILLVGNELRRDDSVALRLKIPNSIKAGISPENFVKPCDRVILIDAVDFNGEPGEVRVLKPKDVQDYHLVGTHKPPINLLSKLCSELIIIGIQPFDTSWGSGLSSEITSKLGLIENRVNDLVKACKQL